MNRSKFIKSLATVIASPNIVSGVELNSIEVTTIGSLPTPNYELIQDLLTIMQITELEKKYQAVEYEKILHGVKG